MVDKIIIENLSLQYSDGTESLREISLGIREKAVTVLFGPAGGGKSTLLRCMNRLNDLTEVKASSGRILIDGQSSERSQRARVRTIHTPRMECQPD